MKRESKIKETRQKLKNLSQRVKPLVKLEQYASVNEAIISKFYENEEHCFFRKFNDWKERGYKIRKGSKGFPVWARSIEQADDQGEEYEYFPICYLFSNAQVEKIKEVEKA